jgi:Bacterial PH domain
MTTAGPRSWGVRPLIPAVTGLLCAGFAIWVLIAASSEDRLVAGVGVFLTAIAAALLLTMRQRLIAGPDGLTVRGPAGARRIRWDQVTGISTPSRRRRGLASTSLELDLDDDGLIVLGKMELGADPVDVAEELRRWWRPSAD